MDVGEIRRLQDQAAEYAVGADRALDDLLEGLGTRQEAELWQRAEDLLTLAEDSALQLRRALREARKAARIAELQTQRDEGNDYGEAEARELAALTGNDVSLPADVTT